jgi:hypothetical protein
MARAVRLFVVWFSAVCGVACSTGSNPEELATSSDALQSTQEQKLLLPDPAQGDQLGNSVSISGTTAIAGSVLDDIGGKANQGSAIVYVRSGTSWSMQQKLTASDGVAFGQFGRAVAVSGDFALVTANGSPPRANGSMGALYAFSRTGTTWTQEPRIEPANPPANENFGFALALSGTTALVSGAATHVFVRTGTTWTEQPSIPLGGVALALSGDTAVIGSEFEDVGANVDQGAVHVFVRSGTSWTEQQRLTASDGEAFDAFGNAVAIAGDTVIVGDARDRSGGSVGRGSAYVFVRTGTTWTQQQKLSNSDGRPEDEFGRAVTLLGDLAIVGAPGHEHLGQNSNHGSAYAFVRSGTSWSENRELRASDGQNNDAFGSSLAMSGSAALIASPNDDNSVPAEGSAYVFRFQGNQGDPCTAAADCTTGFCSDGRCCNSACDGSCNACSVATGAAHEGECTLSPVGSPGSPACAPLVCNGVNAQCSPCTSDAQCPAGKVCDSVGACQTPDGTGVPCSANPCQHGGACTDTPTGHDCACPPGINGTNCQVVFSQMSANASQMCGLRSDGKIACWGAFMSVFQPPPGTYSWLSMSDQHGCAVRTDSSAVCWGHGSFQPPAVAFKSVTAGIDHDCGILLDDTVACWGQNAGGEATPPSGTFLSLALSGFYSCGIRSDGTVACWGLQGPNAQFDVGQATPPPGQFLAISAAGSETCGIRSTGEIACWGLDATGLRGAPVFQYTAIDTSNNFGCTLRFDGLIACFGTDVFGETRAPRGVPPAATFRAFGIGDDFGCGVRTDDVVRCWGIDMAGSPPTGSL